MVMVMIKVLFLQLYIAISDDEGKGALHFNGDIDIEDAFTPAATTKITLLNCWIYNIKKLLLLVLFKFDYLTL